jgi:aspartate/methionine/tyrosine aminotransferase
MTKFDFGWGEPFCVREALQHYYKRKLVNPTNIQELGYCLNDGISELIKLTKQYLKETTGIDYKYIVITNGTTGALNVVLRTFKQQTCFTHKYCFAFYPHLIKKNGYEHRVGLYNQHEKDLATKNSLAIVDSPSNPEGDLLLYSNVNNSIIWDSVYHNPVYINSIPVKPEHRVNCGSYSKVLGVTGVRIGWIATNNESDYLKFVDENLYENCTISMPSQKLIIDILNNTDLENFMRSAKYRINNNRELFDKITYLFDGQMVPENGMFYCAWTSPYVQVLLDRMEIKTITLEESGKYKFLRFNLAHFNDVTNKMVRFLLKEDIIV